MLNIPDMSDIGLNLISCIGLLQWIFNAERARHLLLWICSSIFCIYKNNILFWQVPDLSLLGCSVVFECQRELKKASKLRNNTMLEQRVAKIWNTEIPLEFLSGKMFSFCKRKKIVLFWQCYLCFYFCLCEKSHLKSAASHITSKWRDSLPC